MRVAQHCNVAIAIETVNPPWPQPHRTKRDRSKRYTRRHFRRKIAAARDLFHQGTPAVSLQNIPFVVQPCRPTFGKVLNFIFEEGFPIGFPRTNQSLTESAYIDQNSVQITPVPLKE